MNIFFPICQVSTLYYFCFFKIVNTISTILQPFEYEYLVGGFSVDNVIFGFENQTLMVLLIKRGAEPYLGEWALPGALVRPDEHLDDAPIRILNELTGLSDVYLEQVATFGKVDRHPLGRVITVSYYSLVDISKTDPRPSSFATELAWYPFWDIQDLPFDHMEIMNVCHQRLQNRLQSHPIGFELLEEEFTLTDLQSLYEAVLNKKLDKRNFRKKILAMKILKPLGTFQEGVPHRPAKMYAFDKDRFQKLQDKGFDFDL